MCIYEQHSKFASQTGRAPQGLAGTVVLRRRIVAARVCICVPARSEPGKGQGRFGGAMVALRRYPPGKTVPTRLAAVRRRDGGPAWSSAEDEARGARGRCRRAAVAMSTHVGCKCSSPFQDLLLGCDDALRVLTQRTNKTEPAADESPRIAQYHEKRSCCNGPGNLSKSKHPVESVLWASL